MPLDLLVPGMVDVLVQRHPECPFTNREIRYNVLAEIAYSRILVAFRRQILAVGPEDDKVRLVAVNKFIIVGYVGKDLFHPQWKRQAVLKLNFDALFGLRQLV